MPASGLTPGALHSEISIECYRSVRLPSVGHHMGLPPAVRKPWFGRAGDRPWAPVSRAGKVGREESSGSVRLFQ